MLDTLLSPTALGSIAIKNRIIMAPLTRVRTVNKHTPSNMMVEHYTQRASSGLIIAEATMIMEGCSAFQEEPGIYSNEQIQAWKKVCDGVHASGGKIVLQLWHGGRACHPDLNQGRAALGPSSIAITNGQSHTFDGKKDYTVPRELTIDEIHGITAGFKQAAINAKQAGFDGVELHGANGYLLDAFLRDGSNKRCDQYGGSLENRARFLFETLNAVCSVWSSDAVGLRISPINQFNSMSDSDPAHLTRWLCEKLNDFNLAYLHIMRGDAFGENRLDIMPCAIESYQGNIIGNMGYSAEEAEQAIGSGKLAAVSFGVPFIANPDLVERFKRGCELNTPNPSAFYGKGEAGYNDYPSLNP